MEDTTVFVRIRKDTIRPNPNQNTGFNTFVGGPMRINFTFKGSLPDKLADLGFRVTRTVEDEVGIDRTMITIFSEGVLDGPITPEVKEVATKTKGLTITMTRDLLDTTSANIGSPAYLYDYENPTFYIEGIGDVQLDDLRKDYDYDDNAFWEHIPTGKIVDVDICYERLSEAMERD